MSSDVQQPESILTPLVILKTNSSVNWCDSAGGHQNSESAGGSPTSRSNGDHHLILQSEGRGGEDDDGD